MKLNPDCIRDILIAVESLPNVNYCYTFDEKTIKQDFPDYSFDELFYHVRQCDLSGFFHNAHGDPFMYRVGDLSPLGHQFLADIRSDTVWNKTKNVAAQIGVYSLDALTKIATGVITELIKRQF